MPIYDVFFLEVAKKVKVANAGKPFSLELIRRFQRVLIQKLYDFVDEVDKRGKLEEVRFR